MRRPPSTYPRTATLFPYPPLFRSELKKRGLMFLGSHRIPQTAVPKVAAGLHLVHVASDVVIDREPSREDIDSGLAALERIASKNGAAGGTGHPYPVTLERVRRW